jgi:hypothetical protein
VGVVAAPGTGVLPGLPEVSAVEGGGPPESATEPLAEDGELPEVDAGGLGEAAGGLLAGGGTETPPVDVPGSDTLTRGVPDEDAPGKDTLTKGVPDPDEDAPGNDALTRDPPEEGAPSRDTLAKGVLGADPSGSDRLSTEVCSSDTPMRGEPGEEAVDELDGSGAWALA